MSKVIVTTLLVGALVATGCQTLGFSSQEGAAGHHQAPSAEAAQPTQGSPEQYETTPDLSGAEILTTSHAGAGISADAYQGNLVSEPISMATNPDAVRSGVALSSNLEPAPAGGNAQLGAAPDYSSVSEIDASGGLLRSNQPLGNNAPNYEQVNVTPVLSVNEARGLADGSCSMTLHYEAVAAIRSMLTDLTGQMQVEPGKIFVGPTIIARDYEECVSDLSSSIQDGLVGNSAFTVVPADNINNLIAQNIGSATILPSMIRQCRSANIPYLLVSQIRNEGDKADLSLRIIRTSDGITLNQVHRRLSQ